MTFQVAQLAKAFIATRKFTYKCFLVFMYAKFMLLYRNLLSESHVADVTDKLLLVGRLTEVGRLGFTIF